MFGIYSTRRPAVAAGIAFVIFALTADKAARAWQSEADAPSARFIAPTTGGEGESDGASRPLVRAAPSAEREAAPPAAKDGGEHESRDIQTATFQGVVPGRSTLDQVKQALGEPVSADSDGGVTHLEYRVAPFAKVEVMAAGDVATSVVIHLSQPANPDQIARQLGLHEFAPALLPEETGRLLGQAYPERGVLFVFGEDEQNPGVSHIVLEPISAEPFVMRVLYDEQHRYRRDLADLGDAQRLDPQDARIYLLRARILAALGRIKEARQNLAQAVTLDGENPEYRLLDAELNIASGAYDPALEPIESLAAQPSAPPLIKARAELLWGNILAAGAGGNFQEAVKHHTRAVELSSPLAKHEQRSVRSKARKLLIDAQLAVARDIAWGNWQRKEETVNKWVAQAAHLADDTVLRDHGDPLLRFRVYRGKLAALAGIKGNSDPMPILAAAMKTANEALTSQGDPLLRQRLEWELGETLFDAALAQQSRGDCDSAIQLGKQALVLLEKHAPDRDASAAQHYLLGRVCFRVGSFYAVDKSDHGQAVEWYQKALLQFSNPLPDTVAGEVALHGERYVSMGASYWKTGQQESGLRLTQQGVQLIEDAVKSGEVREQVLAIPYANLAAMHRQKGNEDQAEELARLAREISPTDGVQQR